MTDMRLHRRAREFYTATVVTDPALTSWEASFDYGATWHIGEPVPDQPTEWRWLVAGPEANVGTAVAVIGSSLIPDIRAVDNPEIVVREAPRIVLYGTRTGTAQAPVTSVTSARLVSYDPADSGMDADNVQAAVDALADQTEVARARGRWPVVQIDTGGVAIVDTVTYVPGTYTITDTDGGVVHSGSLNIRGRGNTTWAMPKKPYRLNLATKTALLGMTAEQKNWALLAGWADHAKVNTQFALDLGAKMSGLAWTPQYRVCEVVLNGVFLGLYTLTDLVRLESGRIPGSVASADTGTNLTGVYLVEVTNKEDNGADPGWHTSRGHWIIYDTPDDATITTAQRTYLQGWIDSFEAALFSATWTDPTTGWRAWADETAFADWYLVNELVANQDSSLWSSCKMVKQRSGKLTMGPLWDFDLSFGINFSTGNSPTAWRTRNGDWFARLWADPGWRQTLQTRWAVMVTALGDWAAYIDRMVDAQALAIGRDDTAWTSQSYVTYTPQQADARKRWLATRIAWLGGQINAPIDTYSTTYSDTY